jgi:hypothetical protein
MKAYGGVLPSKLDGVVRLQSRPKRFTVSKTIPGAHLAADLVDLMRVLNTFERIKILAGNFEPFLCPMICRLSHCTDWDTKMQCINKQRHDLYINFF